MGLSPCTRVWSQELQTFVEHTVDLFLARSAANSHGNAFPITSVTAACCPSGGELPVAIMKGCYFEEIRNASAESKAA